MACCGELEKRAADPDDEDRRSGRFLFVQEGKPVEMFLEGAGETITFKFCPFCGTAFKGSK